jgi:hypothetical protein
MTLQAASVTHIEIKIWNHTSVYFNIKSRDSSVGVATKLRAGRSGFYGSIPGGGREFFFSPPCPERLWAHKAS